MSPLLLLACLSLQAQGIQIRSDSSTLLYADAAETTKNPTLREFISAGPIHAALAPIRCATILYMSIFNVLKTQNLSQNIVSMSGSSTGGLAGAIWASMDHQSGRKGYAQIFGKNVTREDCAPNCDKYESFYANYLESPVNSEMDGLRAAVSEKDMRQYALHFTMPFQREPSHEESYNSWVQSKFWLDLFGVRENFEDTKIPLVISGLHGMRSDDVFTVLMTKGNLHLAVLGTTSPPGNTEPLWVSEKYNITDGFFADRHGARGYDALQPEQRSDRILDIILMDRAGQSWPMNFSRLQHHDDLKEAASILMSVSEPLLYQAAWGMSEFGKRTGMPVKYLSYNDIMQGTHAIWTWALDKPLDSEKIQKSNLVSYVKNIDLELREIVPKPLQPGLEWANNMFSDWRTTLGKTVRGEFDGKPLPYDTKVEEFPTDKRPAVVTEVVDTTGLLHEPAFQQSYKSFKTRLMQTYGAEQAGAWPDPTASMKAHP